MVWEQKNDNFRWSFMGVKHDILGKGNINYKPLKTNSKKIKLKDKLRKHNQEHYSWGNLALREQLLVHVRWYDWWRIRWKTQRIHTDMWGGSSWKTNYQMRGKHYDRFYGDELCGWEVNGTILWSCLATNYYRFRHFESIPIVLVGYKPLIHSLE